MRILLKNANMVDVDKKTVIKSVDLIILDNKFGEIGPNLPVEEADEIYDLSNKWVMPGLINMHEHQSYKRLVGPLYGPNGSCAGLDGTDLGIRGVRTALFSLKCGITTLCEMGALYGLSRAMRNAIEKKVIPGPRMFISGQHITMKGGHSHELAYEVNSITEMELAAAKMLDQGSSWVKLLTSDEPVTDGNDLGGIIRAEMPEELVAAAVKTAHDKGAKVAVHAMGPVQMQRVINAGADAIHHGAFLTREQAKEMHDKGLALVSTISAYRNTSSPYFERGEQWAKDNLPLRPGFKSALQHAMEANVLIAPGTDSLGDLVDELIYMNLFGMDTMDCLRSATLNGAKILGQESVLGSISVGKLADLVVLDDDPAADLENLRKVRWVMKNGEIYHLANLSLEHTDPRWLLENTPMDLD